MIYQKLLVGVDPYFVSVGRSERYPVHRHPEIELSYCLKGSYSIKIDKKEHILSEGDLAVVNPMAAHELGGRLMEDTLSLVIEVGPGLLGEQFDRFISMNPSDGILRLKGNVADASFTELADLLDETARIFTAKPPFYSLTVKGNLYKISALLLQTFAKRTNSYTINKSLLDVEKIDRAINIIYSCYDEQLELDSISTVCGYSKSNFCRIFKNITGETFHNMLNRHRIDIACMKLKESNASIEDIALSVGFADTKSFCRVFKAIMGESSGEYKKRYKK